MKQLIILIILFASSSVIAQEITIYDYQENTYKDYYVETDDSDLFAPDLFEPQEDLFETQDTIDIYDYDENDTDTYDLE